MKYFGYILFLLIILPLCSHGQDKKEIKLFRFYDFNIVVDCKELLYLDDYKFVIGNDDFYYKNQNKLDKKNLHYIAYHYSAPTYREPVDTLAFQLTSSQLDTIFVLTNRVLEIDYKENFSSSEYPMPHIYDGMTASVILDLGFRGNCYTVDINYADNDKDFINLKNYLFKIKNGL